MTQITTNITSTPLRDGWARFVKAAARAFENYTYIKSRRAQIEALEAKSDEDLARMGITRDRIAYHVFQDKFYT